MGMLKSVFFKLIALVVFVMFCPACFAKTLNFAIVSDVHYKTSADVEQKESAKALDGLISRLNESNYDFVVFLGDNIDKSKMNELESFLTVLKNLKTPYYLVMGDRDVHKISGMDKRDYVKIVAQYNKQQKKTGTNYVFYPTNDVAMIVLDSVSSGMPTTHGVVSKKTLIWLDETLKENAGKKVVIFQHVPYFAPYEKPEYEILEKQEYKAILTKHNNILAVVSGHYHKEFAKLDDGVIHYCIPALSEAPYYFVDSTLKYDKSIFGKAKNFKLEGELKPAI